MSAADSPTPMPPAPPVAARSLSPRARVVLSIGLVGAGGLVAYGLSNSVDARGPGPMVPPAIAVVEGPATATTNQAVTDGSVPGTPDVNLSPAVTADVALPPVAPPTSAP